MRISDWSSDVCSSDLELAAIGAECRLELCKLLERSDHLALVADQRQRLAVGARIGIGVRGVDVDIGEVVEIAGVGRGRPGAAEDLGIDRKSVVKGKGVSVRVDIVGRSIIKKKKSHEINGQHRENKRD